MYSLKVRQGHRDVETTAAALDLDNPDDLRAVLLGAVIRDGRTEREMHRYRMDVKRMRDGRPEGDVILTFVTEARR